MIRLLLLLGALALSGCIYGGSYCSIAKPHRFAQASVRMLSDAEVQQELTHNEQGARLCGWKP